MKSHFHSKFSVATFLAGKCLNYPNDSYWVLRCRKLPLCNKWGESWLSKVSLRKRRFCRSYGKKQADNYESVGFTSSRNFPLAVRAMIFLGTLVLAG